MYLNIWVSVLRGLLLLTSSHHNIHNWIVQWSSMVYAQRDYFHSMVRLTILIWILIWFRFGFDLKSGFNFSSRLNFCCGFDVVLPPLYTQKVSSLNTCFLLFFTYTLTVSTYGFHLRFPNMVLLMVSTCAIVASTYSLKSSLRVRISCFKS